MSDAAPSDKPASKSRIAGRVRNVNIFLLAVVLLLITSMAAVMVKNITNRASENLANLYSMEAVYKFNAYISQDLAIVRKVARSKAVTDWFSDESNEEKKVAAYNEMMDYTSMLNSAELYFGINDSQNEYRIENSATLDSFSPQEKLNENQAQNDWYYECKDSPYTYTLKIDVDKIYYRWRLWINHKVVSPEGEVVGVFSSGLKVETILNTMFARYNVANLHGYVIDSSGAIQIDSAYTNVLIERVERNIRMANSDPAFKAAIDAYLKRVNGYFAQNAQPQVTRLTQGTYGYVSIAPIANSDWSVVTFFNDNSLFSVRQLLPLLIAMLSAFVLYTLVNSLLIQRLVLSPLNRLTKSLTETSSGTGKIFGEDRNDEIGELALTIQEMRDHLNIYNTDLLSITLEMERQDQLLQAVNKATTVLLTSIDEEKFEASLREGMELMARCMDVDRVYIWKNEIRNGALYYEQIFDWMNELGRNSNPVPNKVSYPYTDNPEWEIQFRRGECINGPLSILTPRTQELLRPCQVHSLLMIPVHLQNQFWGFVNFDDCHQERTFKDEEVNILRSASFMMVNAVNRNTQAIAIREAHERSMQLLDATPLAGNLWNRDFETNLCNEEAVKLFELSSKEEYLEKFWELSPEFQPDGQLSRDKAYGLLKKVFEEGRCEFEWMHQKLDGTPIPVEMTLVRVNDGDGYNVAAYARDLREYRQMMKGLEQRDMMLQTMNRVATILLQSEIDEFLLNLWNCMGLMARAVDADRVYIWKNFARDGRLYCAQLYEWSENAEPQQGKGFTAEVPYDDIHNWEHTLASGNCVNGRIHDLSPEEQEILIPQGILSILVVPVFLRDEFWGFVGFDDCHRERLFSKNEESILRSGSLVIANALLRNEMTLSISAAAARLEAVISNYSGIIWSVNQNNVITLFNGLYLNKLGMTPSSAEGKTLGEAREKNRFFDIIAGVEKTFEQGPQEWHSEIDGNTFRAHTTPIFDENGIATSVVGSIDDITDMIRLQTELESALEKANAASRAKSNFLSNMSHEIRTPMNAIIGMTAIGKTASDVEKKDYALEKIEGASNHLLGIINDILEMSKIEAGKFELSFVEFNFEKLLQKVVNVSSFRIDEKKQNFSIYFDKDIPNSLIGDDQRLTQVITNLLSNAVKFTPEEGSIRLAAYLEKEENGVLTIRFEVKDTGIGISKEQQSRLFTSFEQAESSTSRKFGGTGLGLAISKHIVELMNGKIWVESELGAGAAFIFHIEVKRGEDRKASPLLSGVDWSNIRILAVDDDPDIRESFKNIAEQFAVSIDIASDGAGALRQIEENGPYDILFIDLKMPGMSGIELSQKIKSKEADHSVIIMISAAEWNMIEQEARSAGINDFLPKPLFPSAVAACINKYIGNAEPVEAGRKSAIPAETYPGRRLMLAEDVEINREIVLTMLEPLKIGIDCAINGADAVKLFSAAPDHYDLIFMDLQMPEMDGLEATRRIRALDSKKAKEIPIIAMTANVFREDIVKCLDAGMNDHLGKPLNFDEVIEKIRHYLKSE